MEIQGLAKPALRSYRLAVLDPRRKIATHIIQEVVSFSNPNHKRGLEFANPDGLFGEMGPEDLRLGLGFGLGGPDGVVARGVMT